MNDIEKRARELLDAECSSEPRDTYYAAVSVITKLLTPPEGYVLVPVEPTKAMEQAYDRRCLDADLWDCYLHLPAYAAMIAARPEVK